MKMKFDFFNELKNYNQRENITKMLMVSKFTGRYLKLIVIWSAHNAQNKSYHNIYAKKKTRKT